MKKIKAFLLSVIFLITLTNVSFAKVKVDSSSASSSISIDSALYADGKEVLQGIKTTGGDLVTNGYDIVVNQQRMIAYQYLGVGFLALISICLFIWFYSRINKDKPNSVVPAVLCGIVMIWSSISFTRHYDQVFQGIFNPDYAAIKDIVTIFKEGSGKTGTTAQYPTGK